MKIVAQARQVNPSVKIRIIQRRLIFQLKRKSKIVLYVRIWQIRNLPLVIRVAKAIIKKNLRSIFSVYFSYQPSVFIDAISVQINNHLHRRIFLPKPFLRNHKHNYRPYSDPVLRSSYQKLLLYGSPDNHIFLTANWSDNFQHPQSYLPLLLPWNRKTFPGSDCDK